MRRPVSAGVPLDKDGRDTGFSKPCSPVLPCPAASNHIFTTTHQCCLIDSRPPNQWHAECLVTKEYINLWEPSVNARVDPSKSQHEDHIISTRFVLKYHTYDAHGQCLVASWRGLCWTANLVIKVVNGDRNLLKTSSKTRRPWFSWQLLWKEWVEVGFLSKRHR